MSLKKKFNKDGFLIIKKFIDPKYIIIIKKDIIKIMQQFCVINKKLSLDQQLDAGFLAVTNIGNNLRSNIYKAISDLASVKFLGSSKKVINQLKELNFLVPRQIGTAVIAMEPNVEKFLLKPHQDIRNKFISNHSINLWYPINQGKKIGGLAVYKGSHKSGPLKHSIDKLGKIYISKKYYKKFRKIEIKNFKVGDVVLFHPYIVHLSLKNKSEIIRWTAALCIDDAAKSPHIKYNFSPYDYFKYTPQESNEELYSKSQAKY
jgi:ectoine hydroxylase-related dioxygenase (phytanoyl-CoA dioxygenase family)